MQLKLKECMYLFCMNRKTGRVKALINKPRKPLEKSKKNIPNPKMNLIKSILTEKYNNLGYVLVNLEKGKFTNEELVQLIKYINDYGIDNKEAILDVILENLEINNMLTVYAYIYFALCDNHNKHFTQENILFFINNLSKIDILKLNAENELLVETLKTLTVVISKESDLFINKKIFYNFIGVLFKNKNLSRGIKVAAYNLIKHSAEKFKIDAFKDLLGYYNNLDSFKHGKLPFHDFVIVNFTHFYIFNNNIVNKEVVLSFIDHLILLSDDIEARNNVLELLNSCSNFINNEECRIIIILFIFEILKHEKDYSYNFYVFMGAIIDWYKDENPYTDNEIKIYKTILKCKVNEYIRSIYTHLANHIKVKDDRKFQALKALSKLKEDQILDSEKNAIISIVLNGFSTQPTRNKDLIIDILDNLNYLNMTVLLINCADEEGLILRKKIFIIMQKCLFDILKIKDFIFMYFNFLMDIEAGHSFLTDFNINSIYDDKLLLKFENIKIEFHDERNNLCTQQSLFLLKREYISTFAKFFYFQEDKSIAKYFNIEVKSFLPTENNVYLSKLLKKYSKYHIEKFVELQGEIISLIKTNKNNINFTNDLLSIITNLEKVGKLNIFSHSELIKICKELFKIENYAKKCGFILKKLGFDYDCKYAINNQSLILGSLGLQEFESLSHTKENGYYYERGLIYYLELKPEISKNYINIFKYAIQNIYNNQLNQQNILNSTYNHKNNDVVNIDDSMQMLESLEHLKSSDIIVKEEIFTIDLLKHLKRMLKYDKEGKYDLNFYLTLVSSEQKQLLNLVMSKNTNISIYAFKLISYATYAGAILPHLSVPTMFFYYSLNYNTSIKNITMLYQTEIISLLEVVIKKITDIFHYEKLRVKSNNLILVLIFKYIKSEKSKHKFIKKCLASIDNNSPFYCYYILLNFFYISFSKKEHKTLNESLNVLISNLELCISQNEEQKILMMHMCIIFRKAYKDKKFPDIYYEDLLYKNQFDSHDNYMINELRKNIVSNK